MEGVSASEFELPRKKEIDSLRILALVGRQDFPTDAIRDYCHWLGQALEQKRVRLAVAEVCWEQQGWAHALRELWRASKSWRGCWVLVQYTALGWSRRGFPLGFLPVLLVLGLRKARIAVVFHDVVAYPGRRFIDCIRRFVQRLMMRASYTLAEVSIFTVNPRRLTWLGRAAPKARFVPVGSNIPAPEAAWKERATGHRKSRGKRRTIAVFGITPGKRMQEELAAITDAVKTVACRVPELHLAAFGRGSCEAEAPLRRALGGLKVEVSVLGLVPGEELGKALSLSDVLLDVRDVVSTRRGSVMAAVACGVPVVGYRGPETDSEIESAGVRLVPQGNVPALSHSLAEVLGSDSVQDELWLRSREAYEKFFSWNRVAERLIEALDGAGAQRTQNALSRKYRLAILNSHPVQYGTPFFRRVAQSPEIELVVYFCSRQGAEEYQDPGFGCRVKWDVPLLDGFPHKFLPNFRRRDEVRGFLSLINPSIVKEIWRNRFDAVFLGDYAYATDWLAFLAARLRGVPLFFVTESSLTYHRHVRRPWYIRWFKPVFLRWFFSQIDAAMAIGTLNAEFYRFYGVPSNKIFHLPHAVDNRHFAERAAYFRPRRSEIRAALGLDPSDVVFLFAAKLTPIKAPLEMLEAYRRMIAAGAKGTGLIIAGDGPIRAASEEFAKAHRLPQVAFVGFANQRELPKYYATSDVFIRPDGIYRGDWGYTVNEAMASGLAVISTDKLGAAVDLVRHGENGYIVPFRNLDALAAAMKKMAEDPESIAGMSERSKEIIRTWSYEEELEGLLAALHSLNHKG